jgi:hypothetical protein
MSITWKNEQITAHVGFLQCDHPGCTAESPHINGGYVQVADSAWRSGWQTIWRGTGADLCLAHRQTPRDDPGAR